jgi:prevent-host-death family protein
MAGKPALQVNIHDAKTHLSKYVARAEAGETVYIARAGKVVAWLVPAGNEPPRKYPSILGAMRGEGAFDEKVSRELDEEIARDFLDAADKPW